MTGIGLMTAFPLRTFFRSGLPLLLAAVLSLAAARPAQAQTQILPRVDDLVVDRAGVLDPSEEQALRQKLLAFDTESSTQIVVVTLPTTGDIDIATYATELGQQWGVGQAGKDNGAVLLVATEDRKVFIATGYGLEGAITDAEASRIIRNVITPNFRQGRFYGGLDEATDALIEAARGEFTADERPGRSPTGGGLDAGTIFVLMIILYFVLTSMRHRGGGGGGGRRRRRYHGHNYPIIIGGGGWSGGGGGSGGFGGFGGGGGFGGFGGGGFGGGGAGGSW